MIDDFLEFLSWKTPFGEWDKTEIILDITTISICCIVLIGLYALL